MYFKFYIFLLALNTVQYTELQLLDSSFPLLPQNCILTHSSVSNTNVSFPFQYACSLPVVSTAKARAVCTYRANLRSGWGRTRSHTFVRAQPKHQPHSCPRSLQHYQLLDTSTTPPIHLIHQETYLKIMDNIMNCNGVQKINLFKSGLSPSVSTTNCVPIIVIEFFKHSSAKKSSSSSDQNSPTGNVNIFLGNDNRKSFVSTVIFYSFFL